MKTYSYCPECRGEDLERVFNRQIGDQWGWQSRCRDCDWQGQAERGVDPSSDDPRELVVFEREPFNDWPNGQGVYQ